MENYSVAAVLSVRDNMSDTFRHVSDSAKHLGSSVGTCIKQGALLQVGMKAVNGVLNTVAGSVGSAVDRFDQLNNFPKVMANMKISTKAATASMNKLSKHMEKLPTSLDTATAGVQRFTSANGDIKKSTNYFLALNDAVIAGGQSTQIQQSAIEQLSQAYSKGKLDMMEWRALQQAMPAQLNQVAAAMGMSADALGEGLRSGSVSMDRFMDTVVQLDKKGANGFKSFQKQAEDACNGINTAVSNVKTAISRGLANTLTTIDKALKKNGMATLGETLNNIVPVVDSLFEKIGGFAMKLIDLTQNSSAFQAILIVLGGTLATFATYIYAVRAATAAWSAVQAALNVVMSMNPIGLVIAAIAVLAAGIAIAYKKSETFRKAVQKVGAELKAFISRVVETARTIISRLSEAFDSIRTIGSNIIKGLWEGASHMVSWVVNKFKGLGKSILSGIKNALGIHSPSKEFAKVGRYSGLGLVKGLDNMQRRVKTSARQLIDVASLDPGMSLSQDYTYGINGSYEVVVPVSIDGREVARASAPYTEAELRSRQIRSSRKKGAI